VTEQLAVEHVARDCAAVERQEDTLAACGRLMYGLAKISLPTPVSPVRSTVTLELATRLMVLTSSLVRSEAHTNPSSCSCVFTGQSADCSFSC
jgi:hypothetical protein